jgi:hypothetical protein
MNHRVTKRLPTKIFYVGEKEERYGSEVIEKST